eukprot:198523_1
MDRMAKLTSNLTVPKMIGAPTYGALKPIRANWPLMPYGDIFHAPNINPAKIEEGKSWFPIKDDNDILITSYPKCGHHFTQKICMEIIRANHDGKYTPDLYKTADMGVNTTPWLEFYLTATERSEIEERINLTDNMYPRIWFTHLPFGDIPISNLSKNSKIITMTRNPKDCIVSFWKFANGTVRVIPPEVRDQMGMDLTEYTIDDMISYFVRGMLLYGCYFKWYESYWNALNNNHNVLWLYYEDCVNNPLENVKQIAKFIYDGNDSINEPEKVCNISETGYEQILDRICIDAVRKDVAENPQSFEIGKDGSDVLFRKGVNDEWKHYLSEYQSELIDETMYFKWAQNANKIKYYQQVMELFNDKYNKNYF